ncbi:MAG: hypothetical protein E7048_04940 [Lentisphaerae bacterium]|nr:hypothetical protein [Lentisphaerota bacterium]
MKALLDTNIIIHREADRVINQDIGILFRWLDRAKYVKCMHPCSIEELKKYADERTVDTFMVKTSSYEIIEYPSPLCQDVKNVSTQVDTTPNDLNDTSLLNEVFINRVDILITEDKKIHKKASMLGIAEKVFTIDSFLEKVFSEHPELVNYNVLNVKKVKFGSLNLQDPFFDSLRIDYPGFDQWFIKKFDEECYVTINSSNKLLLSFLYLKIENKDENYFDINPAFQPKKRLKVGTFKVISNGLRLGERFIKIIFDNALKNKVDEVYVTIFDKNTEQQRLIALLEQWGFHYWGNKGNEKVYVRNFTPQYDKNLLKANYPYIRCDQRIFLLAIYPEYHTELLPDSILTTESPLEFVEDFPHRNCISKVYVSRALPPYPQHGDILLFYRTGGYYKSVITTIGIVDEVVNNFGCEADFLKFCKKSTVFPENKLKEMWNYNAFRKPFAVRFLYEYSIPHRLTMKDLIDLKILAGIDDAPRGFKEITKEQFITILKESKSDQSFIIN